MASCVTFEYIRKNPDIRTYIQRADAALKSIGYTEHSFPHVLTTPRAVQLWHSDCSTGWKCQWMKSVL